MSPRLSISQLLGSFREAHQAGWVREEEDTAFVCLHLPHALQRMATLAAAFPVTALHTVAIKAMPLPAFLTHMAAAGHGAEAASLPEVRIAQRAGFPNSHIVWDSPAKTVAELRGALAEGIGLNADNFEELARIAQLLGDAPSPSRIGLRINPQVGTGAIAATSTAGQWSKFGLPLMECRAQIVDAFLQYPWLTGLHMHIGSQGISLAQLQEGARQLQALASEIIGALAAAGKPDQLSTLNIGGGLPVAYTESAIEITASEYAAALHAALPLAFVPGIQLMTEFGRWTFANCGYTASKVEYVKHWGGRPTAILHVGADLLLRECYQPGTWPHECIALHADGNPLSGAASAWTLAGPLCFSGDIPVQEVSLPALEPGHWVILRDTGAYTFSMWSRYNSRQMPRLLGWDGSQIFLLRERDTPEQVVASWQ